MFILYIFFCDNIIYIVYKSLMLQCSYIYICVYYSDYFTGEIRGPCNDCIQSVSELEIKM